MTKKQIAERIEELKKVANGAVAELGVLEKQLSTLEKEKNIPDFPVFRRGQTAYMVNDEGKVKQFGYEGLNGYFYRYFKYEGIAEIFKAKTDFLAKVLYCKECLEPDWKPDWSDEDESKYYVFYNNKTGKYHITTSRSIDDNNVYFSSKENAQKCADWLNSRRDKDES